MDLFDIYGLLLKKQWGYDEIRWGLEFLISMMEDKAIYEKLTSPKEFSKSLQRRHRKIESVAEELEADDVFLLQKLTQKLKKAELGATIYYIPMPIIVGAEKSKQNIVDTAKSL